MKNTFLRIIIMAKH